MLTYGIVIFRTGISLILIKKFEEIVKEKENLKDLTFVDPMTQLFNRNIIENIPNKGKLILIDLDNFKELNDTLGHQFGDKILKEFADILKENTRSTDYVIRLGGDEFAIVTDTENPEQLVNRIRNISIKKLQLDFSYGISNNFNFDKAYSVADKRLYTMKNEKKKLKK
jgi:diguanylate cyclase (GGDEF)-like protein